MSAASFLATFEGAISPDSADRLSGCDVVGSVDSRPLGDHGHEILFHALANAVGESIHHAGFFIGGTMAPNDIAGVYPIRTRVLESLVRRRLRDRAEPAKRLEENAQSSAETREQLEALGYL